MMTKGSLRPATIRRDSVCVNELHTRPIYHRRLAGVIKALGGDWG